MTFEFAHTVMFAIRNGKNCCQCAVAYYCKNRDGTFVENEPLCKIAEQMARLALLKEIQKNEKYKIERTS